MGIKTILLLVAVGIASINAKATKLDKHRRDPVIPDIDYYDCSGRVDTLEIHPWDCTRFIHCDNGRAHDKSCAECHVDPTTCPTGWLHWDPSVIRCEWADVAGCHVSGNQTQETTTVDPTPTEEPIGSSTEEPINTSVSPEDPRCPVNCEYQPVECECSIFYHCDDGEYSEYECPEGLHFNQVTKQCDIPAEAGCNLDPKTCCECKYIGDDACSPDYKFQDFDRSVNEYEGDHHCIRENRSCDNGLVWNSEANNAGGACDFRDNVSGCNNSTA